METIQRTFNRNSKGKIMKKLAYYILAICSLSTLHAEGDRAKLERERFDVENYRAQLSFARTNIRGMDISGGKGIDLFEPSAFAAEADKWSFLETEYPLAFSEYKKLEEFSYFGFKKYDVETGRLSIEDFLKELNEYLSKYHN